MNVRVLLVDDEDEGRADLARRLRRSPGLELVAVARNAKETAGLLEQTQPEVLLVDLHLRNGQELESCRALCHLTDVPVVALASFMTPERWKAVERAGVATYLLKHVNTDQLGRELERIVGRYQTRRSAEEAAMIRRLLVPLDGSKLAERALVIAADIAESLSATLVIARVVPPPVPGRFYRPNLLREMEDAQTKEAEAYLSSVAKKLREDRLSVEMRVLSGPVATTLVEEAKRDASNLIVISSHGMGGLGPRVFGSVAQKLLYSAHCPVLVAQSSADDRDVEEEAEEQKRNRVLLDELSRVE
ncbi:MAG: universal stress protein [Dehalococcoidia bacterium]